MKALYTILFLVFAGNTHAGTIDPDIKGRWIQYHYQAPNGTAQDFLAFDFQDSTAEFSLVCQYPDGTELEAKAAANLSFPRPGEYFELLADVQAVATDGTNVCELNFPKNRVYYNYLAKNNRRSLRILIDEYNWISDLMIRP